MTRLPKDIVRTPVENWQNLLQVTNHGYASTQANLSLIIANDPRTLPVFAFNEFTQQSVRIAEPGVFKTEEKPSKPLRQLDPELWKVKDYVNGDPITQMHLDDILMFLEAPLDQGGYGMRISKRDFATTFGNCYQSKFL